MNRKREASRDERALIPIDAFMVQLRGPLLFVRKSFLYRLVYGAASGFMDHDGPTLGGALAFYTALSMAPLLLLVLWGASILDPGLQDGLIEQIVGLVGKQGGEVIRAVQESSRRPDVSHVAGMVSLVTLAFSASAVFAQLQASLNRIWGVRAKPDQGVRGWLRKRFVSLGMVVTVGFLLLVSLTVSTALEILFVRSVGHDPSGQVWIVLNVVLSTIVVTGLFAALFKVLPDVTISWRQTLVGSIVTAVLFTAGKAFIGIYLGRAGVGSAYGAAGSLIALLVWVYYSAQILFFGVELTRSWAALRGAVIRPDSYAVWIEEPAPATVSVVAAGPTTVPTRSGEL